MMKISINVDDLQFLIDEELASLHKTILGRKVDAIRRKAEAEIEALLHRTGEVPPPSLSVKAPQEKESARTHKMGVWERTLRAVESRRDGRTWLRPLDIAREIGDNPSSVGSVFRRHTFGDEDIGNQKQDGLVRVLFLRRVDRGFPEYLPIEPGEMPLAVYEAEVAKGLRYPGTAALCPEWAIPQTPPAPTGVKAVNPLVAREILSARKPNGAPKC